MVTDFLMEGLRWIVGAFSFGCWVAFLIAACFAGLWTWETWRLHRARRERRKILDVDAWMKRSPEPWHGYTVTVLDEKGRDLFSGRVGDGYRVEGDVKATGRATRFALMHAGTVVREGAVRVARFGDPLDIDTLTCSAADWPAGSPVRLSLPPEWFKSGPRPVR